MEKTQRAIAFDNAATNPEMPLSHELATGIIGDYPYFLPALIVAIKQEPGIDVDERKSLIERASASMCDRTALHNLIGDDSDKFRNFYPDESSNRVKSTIETISHFLDTFGNDDEKENAAIERQIFNPVPDYEMLLEKESGRKVELDDDEMSDNDRLISKFLDNAANSPQQKPKERSNASQAGKQAKPETDNHDSSLLSESLAKIYIRQHRYEKALEIITSLSLNFPEKSIYFADQIRFLKKLIVNEKYKQQNNTTCSQH